MTRGKRCPARAVIFIFGEKAKAQCEHGEEYHIDPDAAERLEIVRLPHQVHFGDGTKVTWARDGEILWVDPQATPAT